MSYGPDFGALTVEDGEVLKATLLEFCNLKLGVKFLEIGMHSGATARGIKRFLEANDCGLDYWAIDPGCLCKILDPFPGAHITKGASEEVYESIPDDFDVIFVDGCHCRNHVILDTFHYSRKVKPGGFLMFHDCSPSAQGKDPQYHGPRTPEFCIDVLRAFQEIGFPWPQWELFMEKFNPDLPFGGVRSYRKSS